jgi:pimeloyl-ACP methyl ester carboxylesterase
MSYSTAGFERRELEGGGVRTVVYSAGRGPDVVYFHGGGTFHGFEFARDFLDRFHVILPYHPGFGESADDESVQSMQQHWWRISRHCCRSLRRCASPRTARSCS